MLDPLNTLLGLFSKDLGIDLGTANTLIYVRDRGIVIAEPSVVALDRRTNRPLYVGAEAKRVVGRTPAGIVAIRPLKDGVITDFRAVEAMLRYFIGKAHDHFPFSARPRVVVGIPCGVTEVERRAVQDAAVNAGAREALLIEEPMAAAIGAGLPVQAAQGSMVVDIGGGTTEVGIISLGGIVLSHSIRVAGDAMDNMIAQYARHAFDLLIGERTAEDTKIALASASAECAGGTVVMRGRDLVTGLPRMVEVTAEEIREAIAGPVADIVDAVKLSIEQTPPELLGDIVEHGILVAGGGALLNGIERRLAQETQMPVFVADDPLTCVVRGTGRCLANLDAHRNVFVRAHYAKVPA